MLSKVAVWCALAAALAAQGNGMGAGGAPQEDATPRKDSTDRTLLEKRAREVIEHNSALGLKANDFGTGRAWLNVERPLSLHGDFAGKVVLIDFWTYCCINCIHVLPDLEYLEAKYAREPFAVIGCHSAKFQNEADADNIRQAVLRHDIAHPVVVDEDFQIWNSFGVRSWPTLILIGPDGNMLCQISGEGQREALDVLIAQALAHYREKPGALSPKPIPIRRESARELARELSFPGKAAVDPEGKRLYISDSNHDRIVVTTLDGGFVRAIGSGRRGLKDGPSAEASFHKPQGLAFDGGRLLVADTANHAIRSVHLESGVVTTIAGTGRQGQDRHGTFMALEAALSSPWDLLIRQRDLFVAMAGPHQIWRMDLDSGLIGPFAGDGSERRADGPLEDSAFAQPSGLAEKDGVLYVADSESSSVRAIDLNRRLVTTPAGGSREPRDLFHFGDEDGKGWGRRLQHPLGVCVLDGVLYVADTYNHKVKTLDTGTGEVKTLAGTGRPGSSDGPFAAAMFHEPAGITGVGRRLFVADTNNHRIRVLDLDAGKVSTLSLSGVPVPMAVALASGKISVDEGPLPEIAGTVRHPTVEAKLASGIGSLILKLSLPGGHKLAAGAPSQFRVQALEGSVKLEKRTGSIEGVETLVELRVEGPGRLAVQVHYYYCSTDETCSVRSARWEVVIAEAPGGGREIVLVDG
ncbi:MAG TPA: thioredoxin-like domain-containing protein [Planctomycetota bacterium]|nr:thioredoxin-like domain-containing protein [Planctomycetota bacterium]